MTMRMSAVSSTTEHTVAIAAIAPLLSPPFVDGLVGVVTPNTTVRGDPVEPLHSHVTAPFEVVVVHPDDDHVFVEDSYCWHEGSLVDMARVPVEKVVLVVAVELLVVGANGVGAVLFVKVVELS